MLRKCDDAQYHDIKTHLPAMQFAINTTYNSVLNCTPFEAGHGLPARTVTQARADAPRIQFNTEEGREGNDLLDVSDRFDESDVKKIFELAMSFAEQAKSQSEWHRRMSNEKLDQTGKKRKTSPIPVGSKIWFYKPPSQEEAIAKGRKVKHLSHYHGPAKITRQINKHIYEFEFNGKTYQREQGMLIRHSENKTLDRSFDHESIDAKLCPTKHNSSIPLRDGEYVIMKGDPKAKSWFVVQVYQALPDKVVVHWLTTITPPIDNYIDAQPISIMENLEQCTFLKAWCLEGGKGRATTIAPAIQDKLRDIYKGRIPNDEIDQHFLIRNVDISSQGKLSRKTIELASCLDIPHQIGAAHRDDFQGEKQFKDHIKHLENDKKRQRIK